jgi:hypothetical protein
MRTGTWFAAVALVSGVLPACGGARSPVVPSPPPSPSPSPTAPLPIQGAYRLVMTVDPACRDQFPANFRVRTYDVRIEDTATESQIWFLNPDVRAFPQSNDPPGTGPARGGSTVWTSCSTISGRST